MKNHDKEIIEKRVDELIPYARNARTHNDAQVAQIAGSIREFGFTNPILIDEQGGIIAGHGRVLAARKLGLEIVPTITLRGLTEVQKRAYILADNKIALNAGWDDDLLKVELEELRDLDVDLDLIGFSDDELAEFLDKETGAMDDESAEPQLDKAEELLEKWKVKLGQTWSMGDHRLHCGSATKREDYSALMQDRKASLMLTDPPYNVAYVGKTKDALKIQNDKMSGDDFYEFLLSFYKNSFDFMEDGGSVYVFHADTEGVNFRSAMTDAGYKLSQCLVWVKNSMVMGRSDYHWQHEPILYGWKPTASHNWYADRTQTTTWNFSRPARSELHPTMKPVDILVYAMNNSSKRGEIVLDPFSGSGSTLIACVKSGRVFRGIEIEPKYVAVILERYKEETGNDPVLCK